MPYSVNLITPPASEPVTLEEFKVHARVTQAEEDALIESYIAAATRHTEEIIGRALITQTWELILDQFQTEIVVPKPPLQSVVSVTYYDAANQQQTLDSAIYQVDTESTPGRIVTVYGQQWPVTYDRLSAVKVRFIAGYTSVPEPIKQAILLLTGSFYENREATAPIQIYDVPRAYDALIYPYRVF